MALPNRLFFINVGWQVLPIGFSEVAPGGHTGTLGIPIKAKVMTPGKWGAQVFHSLVNLFISFSMSVVSSYNVLVFLLLCSCIQAISRALPWKSLTIYVGSGPGDFGWGQLLHDHTGVRSYLVDPQIPPWFLMHIIYRSHTHHLPKFNYHFSTHVVSFPFKIVPGSQWYPLFDPVMDYLFILYNLSVISVAS